MKRFAACTAIVAALLASQVATASQPGPAEASRAARVGISHFEFHPGRLEVARGSRVVFSNSSGTAHTATDRGVFNTGHIKPGHSVTVRFEHKGTFSYHCLIHPFMHGKIVVG
jgi:plastocyanin